jgi:5-methylcytosine-specific restriction endonuclease McrA
VARIRTIKPGFFRHVALYDAEKETGLPLRVAFAGLWTCADREGRFRWQPRELKLDCLPHDDVDFSRVLDALEAADFVRRYEANGETFGFVPSWSKHQVVNVREAKSALPPPPPELHVRAHARTCNAQHTPFGVNVPQALSQTVMARDGQRCVRCGSTKDLTIDHIFPRSLGGTHALANLRTLCRACNSARPVAGQALIDDLAKDGLTLGDMQRMCTHVQGEAEQEQEQEQEGKGKKVDVRTTSSRAAKPTRWPPDAIVPEAWKQKAAAKRAERNKPPIDIDSAADQFANWAVNAPARVGLKVDWYRAFENWVLKEETNDRPGARSRQLGQSLATEVFGGVYARARSEREGS